MKALIVYEGSSIQQFPNVFEDDYGKTFTFHIINENTSAVNLTSAAVTIRAISIYDSSILFTKACSITSATSGYCQYTVADGDLSDNGSYNMELQITNNGVKETINLGYLNIVEKL